jgi:pimeloyl-ACP methyl ester carboxylesterase
LLSLATTRTRHVGTDPAVERYDPDLWTDEFAFLSQPDSYRHDVPGAQIHILDAGHFALDTAADECAARIREFLGQESPS